MSSYPTVTMSMEIDQIPMNILKLVCPFIIRSQNVDRSRRVPNIIKQSKEKVLKTNQCCYMLLQLNHKFNGNRGSCVFLKYNPLFCISKNDKSNIFCETSLICFIILNFKLYYSDHSYFLIL